MPAPQQSSLFSGLAPLLFGNVHLAAAIQAAAGAGAGEPSREAALLGQLPPLLTFAVVRK